MTVFIKLGIRTYEFESKTDAREAESIWETCQNVLDANNLLEHKLSIAGIDFFYEPTPLPR